MGKSIVIHIRDMCCSRCIEAVIQELKFLGLKIHNVKLGEAVIEESKKVSTTDIEKSLNKRGFQLAMNKKEQLIELIKTSIWELIQHIPNDEIAIYNISELL